MSPPAGHALLVTGTDTGVGKTRVACAIAAGLLARGLSVGVSKPCETGVVRARADALPPGSDAEALVAASGCRAPAAQVLPFAFSMPAAPSVAAAAEGARVDLAVIERAVTALSAAHDVTLVEGAGGLLVPLDGSTTFADLAARLALPVLVVARTSLGTLNHTALTVEAARGAGLHVLGVVLNNPSGPVSDADRCNVEALPGLLDGVPVLGELAHGAGVLPAGIVDELLERLALGTGKG